ncbi:alpha/beta hydrolase family protein [Paenibacillus cellulositrophicus]|uniref:alpha/beta hydrolase family protein n=1 Tax=Paenibacillus cellulositrophicus TaxID=562959 RepID=UPI003D98C844
MLIESKARRGCSAQRGRLVLRLTLGILLAGGLTSLIPTSYAESAVPASSPPQTAPIVFSLPEPTGAYSVGTTEMHLIDRGRPDPWVTGKTRELMISIWYPARQKTTSSALAPYMQPGAAAHYEKSTLIPAGISPGAIQWEQVRTHGMLAAPVANPHGRYPVVLYSPGSGVPRTAGTIAAEELASQGYVVVTIDHTYDASEVEFPGGRVEVQALPKLSEETIMKLMAVRELDIRFVLDQLAVLRTGGNPDAAQRPLPNGLGKAMDLSHIGIFGHSAGGAAALQTMYDDRRIDAGILMDGTLGYLPDALLPVAEEGLDRPLMLMGSGYYQEQGADSHVTRPDWKSLWTHSTGWKLDVSAPKGMHFTFTDYPAILPQLQEKLGLPSAVVQEAIGTMEPAQAVSAQRAYVTAFFNLHLRHMSSELLENRLSKYPDIHIIQD